jgi:uncharacterized membrane protein
METLLLVCFFVGLLVGWLYFSNRLEEVEARVTGLEWREGRAAAVQPQPTGASRVEPMPTSAPPRPESPPPPPVREPAPAFVPQPLPPTRSELTQRPAPAPTAAPTPSTDWETTLGGNWLNKLGVFIFVIGLALALGYSFTRLGPWGRVGISLLASFAMLIAGALFEPREQYRTFARGLLGGGWASLYTTVYAMQAIPAALVIHNELLGAVLLLAVAIGMIAHSLRYRSQTVTALAYFIAFSTLAITQVTWLSSLALIPLAASLLFIAHRLGWRQIALVGLVATWTVALLRGDPHAGLWQAQAVMAIYWLLFEAFDLLQPDVFLLPLNAIAALGLSLMKWQADAPQHIWWLLAGAAAAYLASTLLRAARGAEWRPAATLAAGLTAAAIFLRLHHQWIAVGLLVEAELIYLAGVQLRQWYLRAAGTALLALHVGYLLIACVGTLPLEVWVPVAAADAAVFYANRGLSGDLFYGFAGAGMLALIAGWEIDEPVWGRAWLALGVAAFGVGWWRRLFDFRAQGYALAVLGAAATALYAPHPPMAMVVSAAAGYALSLCAARSEPDRFGEEEAKLLRLGGSLAGTFFIAQLLAIEVSGSVLTVAWGIQGAVLLAAGFPLRERVLRLSGLALLFLCIFKLFLWDLRQLDTLPRIFSFLVLGLILLGVSWVYTRFRERVARYL